MTKRQYLGQWLTKAEHDLTIIRQGMDRPEHEWVTDVLCFHAQQVVEKAFKAYLIFLERDPPRTHSLEILLKIRKSDRIVLRQRPPESNQGTTVHQGASIVEAPTGLGPDW